MTKNLFLKYHHIYSTGNVRGQYKGKVISVKRDTLSKIIIPWVLSNQIIVKTDNHNFLSNRINQMYELLV